MYAYIKDRFVVNVLPVREQPAADSSDFVLQRDDLKVGDRCDSPYEIADRIMALEAKQPRAIREAVLTGSDVRLRAIDDEIAALRARL